MFKFSRTVARTGRSLKPTARSASTQSSSSSVPAAKPTTEPTPAAAQSPNYPKPWSTNQRAREDAYKDARFEQTALEFQPQPLSAMEMISQEPVHMVHGRKAVCDGGGGPLGHPKIFINLDKPGPRPCGYCGIRFAQAPHAH
ncbi:zinc-finger domain-containing protein [Phellopilus nigrolimitatus]|nr:zinc-finger domain-containing protein [Phellopilus nigrolimitatus]